MKQSYSHTVLVVDDEAIARSAIVAVLNAMDVKPVCASSGDMALEMVQSTTPRFSLIISDQRMPGLSGYELFEKAREISPETIRFLMTGFRDSVAIIQAINRGAIHRYISKPWDRLELEETIAGGLRQYEDHLENESLLKLAKDQNMKLYQLNSQLKSKAEERRKRIDMLDKEIDSLNKQIESLESAPDLKKQNSLDTLEKLFSLKGLLNEDEFHAFFERTIFELHEQFQHIAARGGFDIPIKSQGAGYGG